MSDQLLFWSDIFARQVHFLSHALGLLTVSLLSRKFHTDLCSHIHNETFHEKQEHITSFEYLFQPLCLYWLVCVRILWCAPSFLE